jgi:S1-C subfamily serine protease
MDMIEQLSSDLANRIAAAAPFVVGIRTGKGLTSGILWRPDVVVTSEQTLPEDASAFQVICGSPAPGGGTPGATTAGVTREGVTTAGVTREGVTREAVPIEGAATQGATPEAATPARPTTVGATLAGRDPGTNVAVLKLETALGGVLPAAARGVQVGNLTLLMGADSNGRPTGRLAMLHALGDAWHSMAGGRIDALIRLDTRLGPDEGGPVLSLSGGLIGMSTSGPRRRTIVIPTQTLARVIEPLLAEGRIAKAWLGIGLQPVLIPDSFHQIAGRESGLMVVGLAGGGPAETAGILPGDIVLDIDGAAVSRLRALSARLGSDRIGQTAVLRVLRAGTVQAVNVSIAARPLA